MNPRDMKTAMKKMGVKQEEIPAIKVIIKTNGPDIVIDNPQVIKVKMMGQESLQITGQMRVVSTISEEDIKTVAGQANVSEEEAKVALEKTEGDLAQAILDLAS
ncbi:MAG: nascent polypeptide-associated complex protein [archaeon]